MILAHRQWGDATGPAAVLVHGAADSSATWSELGQRLAKHGWHVLAVDLPGHGGSRATGPTLAPSLARFAADVVETITTLRDGESTVDRLHGASLGAIVALLCVAERPAFTRRLILEDPPGRESVDLARFARDMRVMFEDPDAYVSNFLDGDYLEGANASPGPDAEALRHHFRAAIAGADGAHVCAAVEQGAGIDAVELASRCAMPTLVMLGRDRDGPTRQRDDDCRRARRRCSSPTSGGASSRRFPTVQCASFQGARFPVHGVREVRDATSAWLTDSCSK
ncbi:MAG: hypothetical protein V7607_5673 [Solirubrobacteraceae bacterium]